MRHNKSSMYLHVCTAKGMCIQERTKAKASPAARPRWILLQGRVLLLSASASIALWARSLCCARFGTAQYMYLMGRTNLLHGARCKTLCIAAGNGLVSVGQTSVTLSASWQLQVERYAAVTVACETTQAALMCISPDRQLTLFLLAVLPAPIPVCISPDRKLFLPAVLASEPHGSSLANGCNSQLRYYTDAQRRS